MDGLFENTKQAAYFLWECTKSEDALRLWHCAEDIACFVERFNLNSASEIIGIIKKGHADFTYVHFVRQMAFRIFEYTGNRDADANWFAAEKLIAKREFCEDIIEMAKCFRGNRGNVDKLNSAIKNDIIRNYYQHLE